MRAFLLIALLCVALLCLPWSGATGAPGAVTEAGGLPGGRQLAASCGLGSQPVVLDLTGVVPDTTGIRLQTAAGTPSFDSEGHVQGRLEVFHDGQWGTVCDDSFEWPDAQVACRQLGNELGYTLTGWSVVSSSNTDDGSGRIWLDDVGCSGSETNLGTDCSHRRWGKNNCGHSKDVGVSCTFIAPVECEECAAGKSSDGGIAACTDCVPGSFSSTGAASCTPCEAGTASATPGAASCTECSEFATSSEDRTKCLCVPGSTPKQPGAVPGLVVPDTTGIRLQTAAGTPSFDSEGKVQGRLEVKSGYRWVTVTGYNGGMGGGGEAESTVACRQLGNELGYTLVSASKVGREDTDDGSGSVYKVTCTGTESTLDSCTFGYWGTNNAYDVGVSCIFLAPGEECEECAAGKSKSSDGVAACTDCVAGTSSTSGAASCTTCEAGTASATPGAATCTECSEFATSSEDRTKCLCVPGSTPKQPGAVPGQVVPDTTGIRLQTAAGTPSFDSEGKVQGRLEVKSGYRWVTVTGYNGGMGGGGEAESTVACRQLGNELGYTLVSASKVDNDDTDDGSGMAFEVTCAGTESTLDSCTTFESWYDDDWVHAYDVGVSCTFLVPGEVDLTGVVPDTTGIRLQTAAGTPSFDSEGHVQGRLEVFHDGQWGTVCDDSFEEPDAQVACRQLGNELGYTLTGWSVVSSSNTDDGNGSIWLDDLGCSGSETNLGTDCSHRGWGSEDCGHSEDVGVSCTFIAPVECEECAAGKSSDGVAACTDCVAGTSSTSGASCEQAEGCACGLGSGNPVPTGVVPDTTGIRLQTAAGTPSFDSEFQVQGRLEVKVGDDWVTVAEIGGFSSGGEAESTVACRQLGNELGYTLVSASKVGRYDTDDGSSMAYKVTCAGTESTLNSCTSFEYWDSRYHEYDVGVSCNFIAPGECEECAAGKSSETTGVAACTPCAAGSWSAVVGSSNCVLCEAGKASRVPGATSADTCAECSEVSAASVPAGASLCDAVLSAERAAVVAVLSNVPRWSDDEGDHCSWSGIACGSDGRVTEIAKVDVGMTSIAPEIGQLTSLKNLNLSRNQISSIPAKIGQLTSLTYLGLSSNQITGGIPAGVTMICNAMGPEKCYFDGNPYICDDGFRLPESRAMCSPCANCISGGTCKNGYDDGSDWVVDEEISENDFGQKMGTCDVCPADTFESAEGECKACSGSALNSATFPLILAAVSAAVGAGVAFLVKKGYITLPTFHLNLVNMIRIKQLAAVMQVFQVFAGLSHLLAAWFLVLAGIFTQFSMPFDINPVCVSSFQNFSRGNLHFTSAWITVVSVALLVAALLNAHRLKCISPAVCQKLQSFAALIVIQAAIVVLPTTIKAQAMADQIREMVYDIQFPKDSESRYGRVLTASEVLLIASNLLTMVLVAVILSKVTRGATKRFGALRKEVIEDLKSLDTVDAVLAQDEEQRGEDLRKWRFFYAAFCMQYTPAGLRQEEHAVARKLKWIVAIKLIEVAELMAYTSFVDNPDKLLPVATAMRCAAIVMVNATFAATLLDRPYVSFRRSKRIGDPSNDAELLTTRVLSWGSAALAFKVALTAETDSIHAKWVMDVICAGVVVGLLVSQRPLFQGAVDVIRDAALSRSSSFGGFGRSSSGELSADEKSKRHSGVTDASSGSEIAAMMECDSFREILYHQSKISVGGMEEAEKLRWAPEVDAEGDLVQKKGWLRGKFDTTRPGRLWSKGQAALSAFERRGKGCKAIIKTFTWPFAMVGYLAAVALFLFL
ncbi:hypothetical protein TeGR_g14787, partial [Tetraparma gracilis]